MSLYYEYIQKMLELDVVYVCTCNPDKFKELIEKKKACPCRKKKAEQNIMEWQSMLDKDGFKEGEAVVRFKSDIKHKNPALREFPLARINETKHPRQGKKYRVWPLMNLAVAVDDMDLEMTHTIRAKDHRDNAERQKMIFSVFGKKYPWSAFLGRYKFTDMNISTTEMRKGIEEGKYSGWDDPKLPTIAALKKKGYRPEAFWGFSVRIGLGENDKVISKEEYFRLLDDFNRKDDVVY
jgi:glutamyl-tRNA synthetase